MPRTLLLLGGSRQQIVAIKTAKRCGYHTILCDYLPDNPGQEFADKFYLESTTDKEAILNIAISNNIDGIVAYASDPAAPTAAFVAEKLGLPGVPYETAQSFCEKDRFRRFLEIHGFNVPKSEELSLSDLPTSLPATLSYPVLVKPTDSSGSKGVSVVEDDNAFLNALEKARAISRNGRLIVEEFITRDHPHVIEAEVFVAAGQVVSWGIINSIRDNASNPLLPAAYSYPVSLGSKRLDLVKLEITRLMNASKISAGAFNIEMIIDRNERLYFLDAGPRNGGNMLPDFIGLISNCDLIEATVKAAMGDLTSETDLSLAPENGTFWGLSVLHSNQPGSFSHVSYSSLAQSRLINESLGIHEGSPVRPFNRCDDLVGLSFFHFESEDEMKEVMENSSYHTRVCLK